MHTSRYCIKCFTKLFILFEFLILITNTQCSNRPNIIFILADDLGWNDVGFHGMTQIPTPNIDALAYSGIILNKYYVTAICTPSRSSLMTGKHPIHTGMQHGVLYGAEPRGLSLEEKLLPEYLKELDYRTHIVGKWHLGSYKTVYTPLYRGFDSHLGYWTGHHDYFDHTAVEKPGWGLDMRRGLEVAYDLHGKYSTDIFTQESIDIINKHNTSNPLFLYIAHAAVHSANPYNPLPVEDSEVIKFRHIKDYYRMRFAGMLSKLDQSVGKVVEALNQKNMLKNSIIVFSTDNGGPAAGFNLNAASNWPLRGVKNTLWEGGVRGAGFIWSPLIKEAQRVASQTVHIVDWLPTLYSAAGGNTSKLGDIDGYDLWTDLSEDNKVSKRKEILHNIDDIIGNAALTKDNWKLVKGTSYDGAWDGWYGPSADKANYNVTEVLQSLAGNITAKLNMSATIDEIHTLRKQAQINCKNVQPIPCRPLENSCLFNVDEDPCELRNVAEIYPEVLEELERALEKHNETAVPPRNLPLDPKGDPKHWNYVWTNFGDFDDNVDVTVSYI